MAMYSKHREISDAELEQVIGGVGLFGDSMMKYEVELELDKVSRMNPDKYKELNAQKEQLLKAGGRHVFGRKDDPQVLGFMKSLRDALQE